MTTDLTIITIAFALQGAFAGAIYGQNPSYLTERFPTEVRATASAFCYHLGAVVAGFLTPILTWFAVNQGMGFAMPMLFATSGALVSFVLAVLVGPETKGKVLVADLEIIEAAEMP
jgi:SHS family lactate transporter-like MFS transporter